MAASGLFSQPSPAAAYAGRAMRHDASMVLKKGFASRLSMKRVTRPMMRPISPAHRQSDSAPPNTRQNPMPTSTFPR